MDNRFIHLLYVPTMACNMSCKYCYLEDNTKELKTKYGVIDTLDYAIKKFKKSNVIPFNISLHGGEVTTLNKNDFNDLIKYIDEYYNVNKDLITSNGFKVGRPHIKTNLYDIDKHIDTIKVEMKYCFNLILFFIYSISHTFNSSYNICSYFFSYSFEINCNCMIINIISSPIPNFI